MIKIKVHISQIQIGDVINHNGKIRTISKSNIKRCSFMGKTLFGDSYSLGYKLVEKIIL